MKAFIILICAIVASIVIGVAAIPARTVSYDVKQYDDFAEFKSGVEAHLKQGYEVVSFTHSENSRSYDDDYTVIFKRVNQ